MNEALKIFTDELARDLKAKLASQQIGEFVDKVKASGDDRSFEVVMSTSDEDRQGDSLDQSTWDFKYYDMNPVVLFAHNYSSFPIGIVTDIKIDGDKAIATGKFAPAGVNADADMACALYQAKILRAVSPGYIQNDDGTRELLEVSFCPVPAGRYALSMRQVRTLGVSTRDLVTKGFFYEEKKAKAEEIGDECTLEDGSPGTLAEDDDNPGALICQPNEDGKAAEEEKTTTESMNKETPETKTEEQPILEEIVEAIVEATDEQLVENKGVVAEVLEESAEYRTKNTRMSYVQTVIYAFCEAYYYAPVGSFNELLDEALEIIKTFAATQTDDETDLDTKALEGAVAKSIETIAKSGRVISAATTKTIQDIITTLEGHNEEHGKTTNTAIASLKELTGSPQDDKGEEQPSEKTVAPKQRSSPPVASKTTTETEEFDSIMLSREVLKAVYQASGEGLAKIKETLREQYPNRR